MAKYKCHLCESENKVHFTGIVKVEDFSELLLREQDWGGEKIGVLETP